MYPEGAAVEGASLRDHLRVVLRRKWIILLALVTVPTVAVILSMRQEALYQATSQVLLNRQNLSGILSGVTDPAGATCADTSGARTSARGRPART